MLDKAANGGAVPGTSSLFDSCVAMMFIPRNGVTLESCNHSC